MSVEPLAALPIERLRERESVKWRTYPRDVLPMFVAETDFPLAPAITDALSRAVELGDTGYTAGESGVRPAFAAFAERRYNWSPDASRMRTTADVSMGIVEILRRVTTPGDRVIVTTPVYPPFFDLVAEAGCVVERVPLTSTDAGWQLDIDGIDAALARGASAVLLCNPHNPTGTSHSVASLSALADSAERHGAVVISDEIHAPLTSEASRFTPFLAVSAAAEAVGFAVTSASKAFNLAGLKCAIMIAASERHTETVRRLPDEVEWRTGLFGAKAAVAAFAPESDAWLDSMLAAVTANHALLADLLADSIPAARFHPPSAGYLAWVDFSALGWGTNPAARILREAKVALHYGHAFGVEGEGFARFNVGCSPEVLREAVDRIAVLASRG